MKKSYIAFGAAALAVIAAGIIIAVMSVSRPGQKTVPDFIMPQTDVTSSNSAQPTSETKDITPGAATDSTSSAAPGNTAGSDSSAASPETTAAAETDASVSSGSSSTDRTDPVTPAPSTSAQSASTATAASSGTVTDTPGISVPETVPENLLLTSGDPLHHIRFEFTGDTVLYSGVYSGDIITDVRLHKPYIVSHDFSANGESFSGSLNVNGLEPGYYIIIARLASNAGMYYVFEMTADGPRAVPSDKLPAASNLAFADAPMELSEEGVIHQMTVSDDRQTAAGILAEIKALSDRICAGIDNDYDKARALCEWLAVNMYYDKDAAAKGVTEEEISLEFVLNNHRSVCFGWSNLYAALCQAQGITCYNASGSVVTGSRCFPQTTPSDERAHSWNLVKIGDRLIWVDCVWNSSNTYEKGAYFPGSYDLQYFDIDSVLLSNDHRVTRLEYRDYFGIL